MSELNLSIPKEKQSETLSGLLHNLARINTFSLDLNADPDSFLIPKGIRFSTNLTQILVFNETKLTLKTDSPLQMPDIPDLNTILNGQENQLVTKISYSPLSYEISCGLSKNGRNGFEVGITKEQINLKSQSEIMRQANWLYQLTNLMIGHIDQCTPRSST